MCQCTMTSTHFKLEIYDYYTILVVYKLKMYQCMMTNNYKRIETINLHLLFLPSMVSFLYLCVAL